MREVEYLIVGQGLAGSMLAFEMLERGMSFHIILSPQKRQASLVAAGMVNPLVFKRLTKSWKADDLLPFMNKRYGDLENLLGSRFYFEKHILKPLSEQETQLWKEKQAIPEFQKHIHRVTDEIEVNGVRSAFAFGEVRGSGYLNLSIFLQESESFFRERELLTYSLVNYPDLLKKQDYFQFGEVKARKIIFCEGYHLTQNPLFGFVKMKPAKGEVLLIKAPELSAEYILNKLVFVLPVGEQLFKVGSTYEWEDLSEQTTEQGRQSIIERLENLIIAEYSIQNHWAGIRPTIVDRRPVLGAHPEYPNIFVFNGLGTKGVMLAPKMANIFCDYLTDSTYTLSDEINVNRFL